MNPPSFKHNPTVLFPHGLNKAAACAGQPHQGGFTVIELLASIAVIVLLVALLSAGYQGVQMSVQKAQSISNLRSISQGFSLFLGDNGMRYPGHGGANARVRWMHRIAPYMGFSPAVTTKIDRTDAESVVVYADAYREPIFHTAQTSRKVYQNPEPMNGLGVFGANPLIIRDADDINNLYWGVHASRIEKPSRTILLSENYSGEGGTGGCLLDASNPYPKAKIGIAANYRRDKNPAADPEGAGPALILFADGHIAMINLETLRPWPGNSKETDSVRFAPQ